MRTTPNGRKHQCEQQEEESKNKNKDKTRANHEDKPEKVQRSAKTTAA